MDKFRFCAGEILGGNEYEVKMNGGKREISPDIFNPPVHRRDTDWFR